MVQRKITGWGQPTVKVGNKTYTDCVKDTCQLSVEEGSVEELQIEGGEAEDEHKDTDRYIIEFDRRVGSMADVTPGHWADAGNISVTPPRTGAIGVTLVDVSCDITLKGDSKDGLVVHHKYKTKGQHDADGNPTDVIPFVTNSGTYSAVDPSSTGYSMKNPKTEGWYIKNGDVYLPARDTEVQDDVTYYELTQS